MNSQTLKTATHRNLIDILQATESWSSSKEGKFHFYTPNPIPLLFHQSTAKTRAIFGGNRSSKTYSMITDFAAQFLGEEPKSLKGLIPEYRLDPHRRLRLNMEDYPNAFIKVIWPYIQQLIPSDRISDVVKEQGRIKAIVNPQGGFIEFMMYESDVRKFQGSSRHSVGYDEEAPEAIRDENLARLIDTDGEEVFAATPLEGSITFLYDEILLKAGRIVELLDGQLIDQSNPLGDPNTHVFFANIYDNKTIDKAAADRILAKYPAEEQLVRKSGHFLFRAGLVYPEYSDGSHLIDPFDDWWRPQTAGEYTLYIAIDPHPRTPHAALFYVVRRDGWQCVVDELFIKCQTAKELVDAINAKCMGKPANAILIDPLAHTPDPSTGSCFAFDLAEEGLYPVPIAASKDKSRGIIMTRNLLGKGKSALAVARNCERFRFEITRYTWGEWMRSARLVKGEKQKPIDKDDHMMENLYRIVLFQPEYVAELDDEEMVGRRAVKRGPGY